MKVVFFYFFFLSLNPKFLNPIKKITLKKLESSVFILFSRILHQLKFKSFVYHEKIYKKIKEELKGPYNGKSLRRNGLIFQIFSYLFNYVFLLWWIKENYMTSKIIHYYFLKHLRFIYNTIIVCICRKFRVFQKYFFIPYISLKFQCPSKMSQLYKTNTVNKLESSVFVWFLQILHPFKFESFVYHKKIFKNIKGGLKEPNNGKFLKEKWFNLSFFYLLN